MARNVEIKARLENIQRQRALVAKLAHDPPLILHQRDVFFRCTTGRLKLRVLAEDEGELIAYSRPDQAGPKTSEYFISHTEDPKGLLIALKKSLGVLVEVVKYREVFFVGRTRVHLDQVESLGEFLELEVVLAETDAMEDGIAEANELMNRLEISQESLVENAYADLLLQHEPSSR